MAVAVGTVHLPQGNPFVAPSGWKGGSWESVAVCLTAVLILVTGPGRFSLDALLFGRSPGQLYGGRNSNGSPV